MSLNLRSLSVTVLCLSASVLSACSSEDEKIVLPTVESEPVVDAAVDTTPDDNVREENNGVWTDINPNMTSVERRDLFKSVFPNLVEGLIAGDVFEIALDACDFDDSGWDGQGIDPLARLACGETYTLSFNKETAEWVSTGQDEYLASLGKDAERTLARRGGNPISSSVYVWGFPLQATEDGRVFTRGGNHVGHIRPQSP